jgi:hypothetical protein
VDPEHDSCVASLAHADGEETEMCAHLCRLTQHLPSHALSDGKEAKMHVRSSLQTYPTPSCPCALACFAHAGGEETEIYSGDQRGFFRKNGHRDAPKLKKALETAGPVA